MFFTHGSCQIVFWQRFRNAHGVLDQAANGCKRLWVVAPKQGFWPKTTWRVTCSKRYTSSLSGVSTPHAEPTYFYTVLMCLTDTFPFCGLLIGCAWKLAACSASSMTEGRPKFALMHNMNVLVKHETFEIWNLRTCFYFEANRPEHVRLLTIFCSFAVNHQNIFLIRCLFISHWWSNFFQFPSPSFEFVAA